MYSGGLWLAVITIPAVHPSFLTAYESSGVIKNLNFSYEDVDYLRGLGLFSEDFLHYLSGFHFSGDIYAIPEGSVIFPREPLLKVVAPIMEAQLVETAILTILNHQCLIATKASRVVYAAQGDGTNSDKGKYKGAGHPVDVRFAPTVAKRRPRKLYKTV